MTQFACRKVSLRRKFVPFWSHHWEVPMYPYRWFPCSLGLAYFTSAAFRQEQRERRAKSSPGLSKDARLGNLLRNPMGHYVGKKQDIMFPKTSAVHTMLSCHPVGKLRVWGWGIDHPPPRKVLIFFRSSLSPVIFHVMSHNCKLGTTSIAAQPWSNVLLWVTQHMMF